MTKIYSTPEHIKEPDFNPKTWREDETKFLNELRKFCTSRNTGNYIGKELRIGHADGYARYMVMSEKPMQLIHIPLGDAWNSPLVDGLTSKKIKELIDQNERLNKLFGS